MAPSKTTNDEASDFPISFFDPSIAAKDAAGRTHAQILTYNNAKLEQRHDYIQYLFPLPEPSPFNPSAPVITKEVRRAFLERKELGLQLLSGFKLMLHFYGEQANLQKGFSGRAGPVALTNPLHPGLEHELDMENQRLRIIPSPDRNFSAVSKNWRKKFDHNHLRITRIIRCLRVLGQEPVAMAFYEALIGYDTPGKVGEKSKMFWRRAAERPLWVPPEEEDDDGAEGIEWLRAEVEAEAEAKREEHGKDGGEESAGSGS